MQYIESTDFSTENSRMSSKGNFDYDIDEETKFEDDEDLTMGVGPRESVLLFSSVVSPETKKLTLESFERIKVLGKGTFGKVYLARLNDTGALYAMKAIRKDVLIETDQIDATKLERDVMLKVQHEFLVGMDFVFQTDTRIYFILPFIRGGELYKHFLKQRRFPEEIVKFYTIQIALAIGHLHSLNIVHRDLKQENILIAEDGYLKVIDFGLAKILN